MNLSTLVRRLSLFVLCIASVLSAEERYFTHWVFEENQLYIDRGGRVNSIAVHPTNKTQMFVASETGGLFKTTDGGRLWTHVDTLPVNFTQSVIYLPLNGNILLVSAKADFKTNNGGGLWRSVNGGGSWERVPLTIPGFTGRLSAYGISAGERNGRVAVGTSEGVFTTSHPQAASWDYSNVFINESDKTVYSVLVENVPSRLHAGGPKGVRFATTFPPTSWQAPATPPGNAGVLDIHALGGTPLSSSHKQVYVVNGATELFRTGDGITWTRMEAPPGGPGCAGSAFLRVAYQSVNTIPPTTFLELYLGNRCKLHRLRVPLNQDSGTYTNSWAPATHDGHSRDLALWFSEPVLLGSDFGLHKTVIGSQQGLMWNLAGNGKVVNQTGGYNALQIAEVDGQNVGVGINRATHLYIATQDNNIWASHTLGNVWESYPGSGCFIELERDVEARAQSEITFVPGNYPTKFATVQFGWITDWNNPPAEAGKPAFVRRGDVFWGHGQWVQQVKTAEGMVDGLATTENSGQTWRQFATYPEEPRDIPKLGREGSVSPRRATVLYQPYRKNGVFGRDPRRNHLMRISRQLNVPQAEVGYPDMIDFGGLGTNPTMFAWYQVFGVDPGNPDHLIAPDVVRQEVRQTTTGGMIWTLVDELKAKVTAGTLLGGPLNFRADLSGGRNGEIFPIITAVSFCPDDPQLVVVGTHEGGIFFSNNNGLPPWHKIANTEQATYITSFFWKNTNTVFVGTYGRGLWKLENKRVAMGELFEDFCVNCEVLDVDSGGSQPDFAGSVLAFRGSVLGVRTEDKLVREVFVTPGSSVLFTGDLEDAQEDITITESDGRDTTAYTPLPKHPDGWLLTGVVFAEDDTLTGAVYAEGEMSLVRPVEDEERKYPTLSPTAGKPYIRVSSANNNGVATVAPQELLDITATDFAAGGKYELLIDGEPLKDGGVTADGGGSFSARIPAPLQSGYHRVEVRMAGDEEVIDASEFVVR